MSLFNLDQIPEKETTSLQCEICKGMLVPVPKKVVSKFLGMFKKRKNKIQEYRCAECNKELFISERL